MTAWGFIRRLIRYSPGLFALNLLAWTAFSTVPLMTGLVSREVFDSLEGIGRFGYSIPTLLVLIACIPLARKVRPSAA